MGEGSLQKTIDHEEARLRASSQIAVGGRAVTRFYLPAMHCGGCMQKVERGLLKLPFVQEARTNLSTRRASVTWNANEGTATEIANQLGTLGFEPIVFAIDALADEDGETIARRLLMSIAVAGFATANVMLLSISVWSGADDATRQLFHLISGLIAVPAVAYAGQPFFASAARALRHRHLNMDVPVSLAVLLALALSAFESIRGGEHAYFDASVMLLFFLLIGRYLDQVMRERARSAVRQLGQLASKGAVVLQTDGTTQYVSPEDVAVGNTVIVAAGERFPVDGEVTTGSSKIDRSLVTGESEALTIGIGGRVEAGTLNLSGPVEILSTKRADQSFLAEIVQMMEAAGQGKAKYVRIADRVARIYAPAVHVLAFLTFAGWMVHSGGDAYLSIYTAVSVLIITCPCALGLAVPIVQVVGAGRLFDEGIMIRDGAAFEKLTGIDTVVFDKTGTLTYGKPVVIAASACSVEDRSLALHLARSSSHPVSQAIRHYLSKQLHSPGEVVLAGVHEEPGSGIAGYTGERQVRLGRRDWVAEITHALPAPDIRETGAVYFARQGQPATVYRIADALRPDAHAAIQQLQAAGLDLKLISGDAAGPVVHVADELGIAHYQSGMTPKAKVDRINSLQQHGHKVLIVGDGINDAPALAAGHVSMAPSSGSDVGRQAADFVFMHDSLAAVPFARKIAIRASRLVQQNFVLAIAYNCLAIPAAMLGNVTPLVAAIAMSGSSIAVVANSMRLRYQNRLGQNASVFPDAVQGNHNALRKVSSVVPDRGSGKKAA